jgi:hypothetical protein
MRATGERREIGVLISGRVFMQESFDSYSSDCIPAIVASSAVAGRVTR